MLPFLLAAALATSPDPAAKIAPHLARALAAGPAEMIVVLKEAADLGPAASLPTRLEKGAFVVNALRATASRSQAPLLSWLASRGMPHRSFTIVNAVWVKGNASAALAIAARPDVLRVEANPVVRGIPPEPPAPLLLPLAVEPGVSQVNAPAVWATGNHGEGIVVADADTGVRYTHHALVGHYRGTTGGPTVHDRNWHDAIHSGGGVCGADAPAPCDDFGHGTETTGFAVGDDGAGNQIGTAPGAKWIACRNMDQGNGTPARYIECMEFFLAPYPVNGTPADGDPAYAPDIVNNSWGCPPSEGCSVATLDAALAAQTAAGILNVAAAGNSGPSCSTISDPPAPSPDVLTVGALITTTTSIAGFSSLGPVTIDGSGRLKPDLVAPGTNIRSATSTSDTAYASGSGTSYASPLTAGAAALLLAAHPALKHQPRQAAAILTASAAAISASSCGTGPHPNATYGWGLVDAGAAVTLGGVRPVVTSVSPSWGPTAGGTTVTVTGANFRAGDSVVIGGTSVAASNVTSTSLDFVTPSHANGPVDVTVDDSAAAQSGTLAAGFSYCDGTNGCGQGPLAFYSLAPCRLVDTRNPAGALGGPALAPNAVRSFRLEGSCGIPAGARSLALNVTAVTAAVPGTLHLFPYGTAVPAASVLSFSAGVTRAGFAIGLLDGAGRISVQCDAPPGAVACTDLLLDVSGFFR